VRIFAHVFEGNIGSMRVLKKAGYAMEGRHRKAVTKDGQTLDEFTYAFVRED
jgi:ribosomal-protein-alanine N-acetyltransferase